MGKSSATILLALMMTITAVAVQGTRFSNQSCVEADEDGDSIYCKTAVGPINARHKTVSAAFPIRPFCHHDGDPLTPFPCDPETGTIVPSAGGAIFLNDFAEAPTQDILFELWVGPLGASNCLPGLLLVCGFDVLLCNDRDINTDLVNGGICTNVNDDSDQLRSTQSNEPLVGEACPPDNKDKDQKNCGDNPEDAYIQACFMPKEGKNDDDGHWAPGQIVVFIGNWADSWPGGGGFPLNIGAGLSAGLYEIWLREGPGCIVPACDDRGDNDGDDNADYPDDVQCLSADDSSEGGVGRTACSDGIDNDGDGAADHPDDPGCTHPEDVSELGPACGDGTDNDGDGGVDYPDDPGCIDGADVSERGNGACDNGLDDDGDTFIDFGSPRPDPGCTSLYDSNERNPAVACDDDEDLQRYPIDPGCSGPSDTSQSNFSFLGGCDDGVDNDGDTFTDFGGSRPDPGCSGPTDPSELDSAAECDDGLNNDIDGLVDFPDDPGCNSPTDPDEYGASPCDDGEDNDQDTFTDFPNDPGCPSPGNPNINDDGELSVTACDNDMDDDGDGGVDYPDDQGCISPADPYEREP